jgi:hypothetical protein
VAGVAALTCLGGSAFFYWLATRGAEVPREGVVLRGDEVLYGAAYLSEDDPGLVVVAEHALRRLQRLNQAQAPFPMPMTPSAGAGARQSLEVYLPLKLEVALRKGPTPDEPSVLARIGVSNRLLYWYARGLSLTLGERVPHDGEGSIYRGRGAEAPSPAWGFSGPHILLGDLEAVRAAMSGDVPEERAAAESPGRLLAAVEPDAHDAWVWVDLTETGTVARWLDDPAALREALPSRPTLRSVAAGFDLTPNEQVRVRAAYGADSAAAPEESEREAVEMTTRLLTRMGLAIEQLGEPRRSAAGIIVVEAEASGLDDGIDAWFDRREAEMREQRAR